MIRSRAYIGHRKVTVRYTDEQWLDPEFRKNALADARQHARTIVGEVIIKVGARRTLRRVASVRYVAARNGFNTYWVK